MKDEAEEEDGNVPQFEVEEPQEEPHIKVYYEEKNK